MENKPLYEFTIEYTGGSAKVKCNHPDEIPGELWPDADLPTSFEIVEVEVLKYD